MSRLNLSLPWVCLALIIGWIALDFNRERGAVAYESTGGTLIAASADSPASESPDSPVAVDPVCGMQVRRSTAHRIESEGRALHFCTDACRDEFLAVPAAYPPLSKPPAVHMMRGVPIEMVQGGVALILILSFGLFEALAWWGDRRRTSVNANIKATIRTTDKASPTASSPSSALAFAPAPVVNRLNLTARKAVTRALRWGPTRFALQAVTVVLFLLVIIAGLFGNQNPALNIAPLLTWTIWWAGLIFVVLFFGGAWCAVCPWDALATWIERLKFWGPRDDRALGLDLRWPKALRNVWPAIILFLALTWIELGMGITLIPRATAWVALAMLGLAVGSVMVFDRKSFCRYGCFVGRITGMYSLFSSLELRSVDPEVCADCKTIDCYHGNERGDGCPTFQFPKTMQQSTYCTMCTECIKTCPHENIAIRLRPWSEDLLAKGRPRSDEAFLAVILLALTGFHGLTMTPNWAVWNETLTETWALPGRFVFALLMTVVIAGPILLYAVLARVAAVWSGPHKTKTLFIRYAYALLPIALFYHLAHNAEHFLMESPKIVALASDPMGLGWDLFGTAEHTLGPLLTLEGLWALQVAFVVIGHIYGLRISGKTARSLVPQRGRAFISQLPMAAAMVAFSTFSLWLLSQPMEMRISGM